MGQKTKIAWCDSTLSVSYGCSGCEISGHCYAERMCRRFPKRYPGLTKDGRWTGKIQLNEKGLDIPLKWKRPRKIFVNSCGDLFAPGISYEYWRSVVGVMTDCPQHTFMILTKQPSRMKEFVEGCSVPPNCWLGVSVTDQKTADQRIELLRQTPAAVRLISAEPLLAPITPNLEGIGWLVVGGESGPGARPMHLNWVRGLRDQCQEVNVAFFFKQYGKWREEVDEPDALLEYRDGLPVLDGRVWSQFPEVRK